MLSSTQYSAKCACSVNVAPKVSHSRVLHCCGHNLAQSLAVRLPITFGDGKADGLTRLRTSCIQSGLEGHVVDAEHGFRQVNRLV